MLQLTETGQLINSSNLTEMLTHQIEQNVLQLNILASEIESLSRNSQNLDPNRTDSNHAKRAINTLQMQFTSLQQFNIILQEELDEELLIKNSLKEQIGESVSMGTPKSQLRRPSTPNLIKRSISLEMPLTNSRPTTPSYPKRDPFDGSKAHHIRRLEYLKNTMKNAANVENAQREITETFISIFRDIAQAVETRLGKAPCNYAIFVGGSVGRRETSVYSDVEFGIVVESKENIEYFQNLGSSIATHLDEVGIECDENFSPPHLTKIKHETFQKDWRGVYFYNDEGNDEQFAKKGSNLLLDTPENFASWQQIKAKVAGSAVLASILRESLFVYGEKSLYEKFHEKSWHSLRISKDTRREFFNIYLSSLKQLVNKLPIVKHVDNALYMENFPLTYDLKDIIKCIYTITAAIALAGNVEETNGIERLNKCKELDFAPAFTDKLLTYQKFLYGLRLEMQSHYQSAYHLINGLQYFSPELKSYKKKFYDSEGPVKLATIEWYRRTIFQVKAQLKESSELSEKSMKKLKKLWKMMNNTDVASINEKTLTKLEKEVKKLESLLDGNKYFLSHDMEAKYLKTKPMTLSQIQQIKVKIENFKNSLKSFYGEVYDEANMDEYPITMPSFMDLESDLDQIESLVPTIRSKIETNPFILSTSQLQTLKECIAFIKESVDKMPTVSCV